MSDPLGDRFNHGAVPGRDALFVSAGDHHLLHRDLWGSRDFDVLIAWYGSDEAIERSLRSMADFFVTATGGKFQNLWTLWRRGELALEGYDSVFVADDDVSLRSRQIAALFRRRRQLNATILSPAQSSQGAVSHQVMLYQRAWDHHFTNFVECNTPVFRGDALIRFLNEFDGSLVGWGIDYWYMNLLDEGGSVKFIVDDSVTFVNPRTRTTSGGREIERLGTLDQRQAQWDRVSDERKLHAIAPVVLGAVPARLPVATWRTITHTCSRAGRAVVHPRAILRKLRGAVLQKAGVPRAS
jgi:hypothetical protein